MFAKINAVQSSFNFKRMSQLNEIKILSFDTSLAKVMTSLFENHVINSARKKSKGLFILLTFSMATS